MSIFRFLPILAVCLLSQGCIGIIVYKREKTTIQNPSIGGGDYLYGVYEAGAGPKYTTEYLKSHWGTPKHVKTVDAGTGEEWTYATGPQCISGVMPMVVIAIPLLVPTGKEKAVFLIRDDRVVRAKLVRSKSAGIAASLLGPEGPWSMAETEFH